MPEPANNLIAPSVAAESKEVVLPMNISLAERVELELPPVIIQLIIPQDFFDPTVRSKEV